MLNRVIFLIVFNMSLTASVFAQKNKEIDTAKIFLSPSITVTSTRAIENKSPVPFINMDYKEISEKQSVQDLPMLLNNLPSIVVYSENGNGIGYSDLTMRGFDQRRISVMINGIPQNDPEDHGVYWIDFPDMASNLENIQVQRGAGLINYGSAAIGGSINLTTSNFTKHQGITIYSGMGFQQYASGDSGRLQSTVNKQSIEYSSGVVGDYAFYGRLSRIYSLGYRDRSWADLNSLFFSAIRFDKNFTTQINIFGGPITDGLSYNGIPKSYISDPNLRRLNPSGWAYDSTGKNISWYGERRKEETEWFSQPHFEMLNDWKISDNLSIKSALFYYQGDGYFNYDGSWADTSMLRLTSQYGYHPTVNPGDNTLLQGYVANKQGGWIPRLIFNHDNGELTVGAEFRIHRADHYGTIVYANNLPEGFSNDYKFYSYTGKRDILSFFARERYELNDKLALSAEFQIVHQRFSISDEKAGNLYTQYFNFNGDTIRGQGDLFNINYLFFNPRLGATWNVTKDLTFYSQFAVTSHEPRMRNFYPADDAYFGGAPIFESKTLPNGNIAYNFTKPLVKPETMLNYELGTDWKKEKFHFSANFYWMEYFDELILTGRVDIFGNPIDENAKRTRHYGIEFTGAYDIINKHDIRIGISANATISKNTIIDYNLITSQNDTVSLAGNQIPGFPDFMGNITLEGEYYGFYFSIQGKYCGQSRTDYYGDMIKSNPKIINSLSGSYYSDNTLDPFFVMNANLSYTIQNLTFLRHLKVQLQVNNILNRLYAAGAQGKDFFPAAERNVFLGIELGL